MADGTTAPRFTPKSDKNAGASTALGIIMTISQRLAELSPKDFIPPERPSQKGDMIEGGGVMTDDQKRLSTLLIITRREHDALKAEADDLYEQIKAVAEFDGDPLDGIKHLLRSGLDPAIIDRYQELQVQLPMKRQLHSALKKLFWIDVKTQFPALADKEHLVMRNDWTVCWHHDGNKHAEMFGGFEIIGMDDLPEAFRDMLMGRRSTREREPVHAGHESVGADGERGGRHRHH